MGMMVKGLNTTNGGNSAGAGVETVGEVRAAGRMLGGFSPELAEAERRWKSFMYTTLYHHQKQRDASEVAQKIVNDLFIAYHADPKLMTTGWAETFSTSEPQQGRHIADNIAGMKDRSAPNGKQSQMKNIV